MAKETWREIAVCAGRYLVSDRGNVKRNDGYKMKPQVVGGYPFVTLRYGGKKKTFQVHLLVIRAFVGPAPEGMQVRHLDGNRENPELSNLRYGTKVENEADKQRHGSAAVGSRHGMSVLTEKEVVAIRRRASRGETYRSISKSYSVEEGCIGSVVRRVTWRHIA